MRDIREHQGEHAPFWRCTIPVAASLPLTACVVAGTSSLIPLVFLACEIIHIELSTGEDLRSSPPLVPDLTPRTTFRIPFRLVRLFYSVSVVIVPRADRDTYYIFSSRLGKPVPRIPEAHPFPSSYSMPTLRSIHISGRPV